MNSIIRDTYKAKIDTEIRENECVARLHYRGQIYGGKSTIHPDDKDFFSPIVGTNIAISRARQHVLWHQLYLAKIQLKAKKEMYWQATAGVSGPVDPTGRFFKALTRAENNVKELRAALRAEKRELNIYLSNQNEAITKIKGYRAEKAEDN